MHHAPSAAAIQVALFASTHVTAVVTDAAGLIQVFNVGAERSLGFAAAEVLGKLTPAAFIDPLELASRARALNTQHGSPVVPGFDALVFLASRNGEDVFTLTEIRKDGSRFRAELAVSALRDEVGGITGYLFLSTDSYENIELHAANLRAQQVHLAKSDFLSTMGHELRSPLTAILGYAQLMESDQPAPSASQVESIREIRKAGRNLLRMINEILDLAKIESGRLSLSLEPVSLATVMVECQGMAETQAQRRGVRMGFPTLETPCFVRVDSTRLKQVLMNFLTHAIQYNRPSGSVMVACDVTKPGRVRVSIRDEGPGLTPQQLTQLFQPFSRAARGVASEEGAGVGLAVTRQLVELMGGSIGVESTVGSGSLYWFEVNASVEPEAALR